METLVECEIESLGSVWTILASFLEQKLGL